MKSLLYIRKFMKLYIYIKIIDQNKAILIELLEFKSFFQKGWPKNNLSVNFNKEGFI